jgi:N-terminal C2 in EEIG1 and EHBP1 proteins
VQPKFDLTLRILDLTNIPLVAGTTSVKWHLPSSSAAEHRGKTDKAYIQDHKATWEYSKTLAVRLTIERTLLLQECDIHFEVLQEYSEGVRGGRVLLGNVKLNLAEYTQLHEIDPSDRDPQDESEHGSITRRYLLQDSKINCTLKIGISMKQTEGDTNFIAPPLKSAMVVGGIAGILATEPGEGDDMPSITSKTRELSEAQDLYRRTLAATWACHTGELPPDKLIEDLFAGGDGGGMQPPKSPAKLQPSPRFHERDESMGSSGSEAESRRTVTPRHLTPEMARTGHRRNASSDLSNSHTSHSSTTSVRSVMHHHNDHSSHKDHGRRKQAEQPEPTEFDLREDLRSWQVQVR